MNTRSNGVGAGERLSRAFVAGPRMMLTLWVRPAVVRFSVATLTHRGSISRVMTVPSSGTARASQVVEYLSTEVSEINHGRNLGIEGDRSLTLQVYQPPRSSSRRWNVRGGARISLGQGLLRHSSESSPCYFPRSCRALRPQGSRTSCDKHRTWSKSVATLGRT